MAVIEQVVSEWLAFLHGRRPGGLEELLDDEVVFYSPIVYTPQRGKQITARYLRAAASVLPGDGGPVPAEWAVGSGGGFRYTKQVLGDDTAVLEFETTVEGVYVNGVDIIRCNDAGRIVEFRVMIRPLRAVDLVHRRMASALGLAGPERRDAE